MMKEVKFLEIRDRATCVPAVAMQISGEDGWIARRAGFQSPMIYVLKLTDGEAHYDPYDWNNMRTMGNAHRWVAEHWEEVKSGDVVDVEFILGETSKPKDSEQLTSRY